MLNMPLLCEITDLHRTTPDKFQRSVVLSEPAAKYFIKNIAITPFFSLEILKGEMYGNILFLKS